MPADLAAARAVLAAEATRHPYAARPIEILEAAAATPEGEYRASVAMGDAGAVVGVVLFGAVAGTIGGGTIYGLAVAPRARRHGVGRALVDHACAGLAALGARLALAELPDDHALDDVRALLASAGFAERARVPDLVREGVALTFFVRALDDALDGAPAEARG